MNVRFSLIPLAVLWTASIVFGADSDSGSVQGVISSFNGKGKIKLLTVKVREPGKVQEPGKVPEPDKKQKPGQEAGQDPGQKPDQKEIPKADQNPGQTDQ